LPAGDGQRFAHKLGNYKNEQSRRSKPNGCQKKGRQFRNSNFVEHISTSPNNINGEKSKDNKQWIFTFGFQLLGCFLWQNRTNLFEF
jgi:hypothetical protein